MEDSILDSVKKSLGVQNDLTAFDQDIIMSINSVFSVLNQIGVVSSTGSYRIEDNKATWTEFFGNNDVLVDMLKTYTYLKVRVIFDPPTSSFVLDSIKSQAQELEWRINIEAENSDFSSNYGSKTSFEKVDSLPDVGKPNIVYLVANGGSDDNVYDEYFWIEDDSRFELFGTVKTGEDNDQPIPNLEIDKLFK